MKYLDIMVLFLLPFCGILCQNLDDPDVGFLMCKMHFPSTCQRTLNLD